jgi:hypothetical protein
VAYRALVPVADGWHDDSTARRLDVNSKGLVVTSCRRVVATGEADRV